MAQQRNLFPPNPKETPREEAARRAAVAPGSPNSPIRFLARTEALVRVVVRLYLGLLVTALPWLGVWAQNNLWTYNPALTALAGSGFVRGLVTGLGLLNIWMAVEDARTARELF